MPVEIINLIDYKLVSGEPQDVSREVKQLIVEQHYDLYGFPLVAQSDAGGGLGPNVTIIQAVVKRG